MSLNVSTKNSVDEPSKVTIQVEGRPPCRVLYRFNSSVLYHMSLPKSQFRLKADLPVGYSTGSILVFYTTSLDKGHVPEKLWKSSVTYLL